MKQKEEVGDRDLLLIFCFPTFDLNCGFTHGKQLTYDTRTCACRSSQLTSSALAILRLSVPRLMLFNSSSSLTDKTRSLTQQFNHPSINEPTDTMLEHVSVPNTSGFVTSGIHTATGI